MEREGGKKERREAGREVLWHGDWRRLIGRGGGKEGGRERWLPLPPCPDRARSQGSKLEAVGTSSRREDVPQPPSQTFFFFTLVTGPGRSLNVKLSRAFRTSQSGTARRHSARRGEDKKQSRGSEWFRRGLLFKSHRFVYHSALDWRVIKKRRRRIVTGSSSEPI